MIKIEEVEVAGFRPSVRGMRNPLQSWDKSDSYPTYLTMFESDFYEAQEEGIIGKEAEFEYDEPWVLSDNTALYCDYHVGKNDKNLMHNLADAGTDHSKFSRMMTVWCDITAPLYWWKEFDTYRVGVEKNSSSTMHRLTYKPFEMSDFSFEHLINGYDIIGQPEESREYYENPETCLEYVISVLNYYRKLYIETKDKLYWWQMIQLLPSSYNQLRTVQMSYQALSNMYFARRNHKLDEWHTFCDWVETLPYFKEIYLEGKKEKEVRAKWITQVGGGGFNEWVELKCSNCRGVIRKDVDFKKYKYCPFCGAKMDLED